MRYRLPQNVTCAQCVLQWRYIAANNWGRCENSSNAIGCGPQEEFRACADISIQDKNGEMDETPYEEPGNEEEEEEKEEIEEEEGVKNDLNSNIDENVSTHTGDVVFLPLFIILSGMFLSIFIYVLLFIYYYGANKTIKPCWQTTVQGMRQSLKINKMESAPPLPPPRTKKSNHISVVSIA